MIVLLRAPGVRAAGIVTNCSNDTDLSSKLAGGGTVTFDCGTATIKVSGTKTISQATTIDGDGTITLDGNHAVRLFHVASGASLDLQRIVLTNGYGSTGNGGSVLNEGFLALDSATIENSGTAGFDGGAVATTGAVDVTDSVLMNNNAGRGGAIFATGSRAMVSIGQSKIDGNSVAGNAADSDRGGAIAVVSGADVEIVNGELVGNHGLYGGAIAVDGASLTITGTLLSMNHALEMALPADGGAIYNQNGGVLHLTNAVLDQNSASDEGGGIYNKATLTLTSDTVSGNSARIGGGLGNFGGGTTTASHCWFVGNQETLDGFGGAGIDNRGGTLTLGESTFSGNSAQGGGGGMENSLGGVAHVTNVTFSGNAAGMSGGEGGGFYNFESTADLTNVTFYGNSATHGAAIADGSSDANTHLSLKNVLVAHSTAGGNCAFGRAPDVSTGNLSTDDTCAFGTGRDSIPVMLGKLETNGGDTLTHRLLPGSAAIDAGVLPGCPATDQRGLARYFGHSCDVGAFEFQPCSGAPTMSTLLTPKKKAKVRGPVDFDWAGPDCAKKFELTVRGGSPSGAVVFDRKGLKPSQFEQLSLPVGGYFWQVTACRGAKCTPSDARKFTVKPGDH